MSKKSDELIDEAHKNLAKDREGLEEFRDVVLKVAKLTGDPVIQVSLSDSFAKIVDGLTKNNAQLVELAKLRLKKEFLKDPKNAFSDDETDTMFDEIEGGKEEPSKDDDDNN